MPLHHSPPLGAQRLLINPNQNALRSILSSDQSSNNYTLQADTIHWVYMGTLLTARRVQWIALNLNNGGSGSQDVRMFVASSAVEPYYEPLILTILYQFISSDSFLSYGRKRTTAPSQSSLIPKDTHLWVGIRCNMTSSQPAGNRLKNMNGMALSGYSSATNTPEVGNQYTCQLYTDQNFCGPNLGTMLVPL